MKEKNTWYEIIIHIYFPFSSFYCTWLENKNNWKKKEEIELAILQFDWLILIIMNWKIFVSVNVDLSLFHGDKEIFSIIWRSISPNQQLDTYNTSHSDIKNPLNHQITPKHLKSILNLKLPIFKTPKIKIPTQNLQNHPHDNWTEFIAS